MKCWWVFLSLETNFKKKGSKPSLYNFWTTSLSVCYVVFEHKLIFHKHLVIRNDSMVGWCPFFRLSLPPVLSVFLQSFFFTISKTPISTPTVHYCKNPYYVHHSVHHSVQYSKLRIFTVWLYFSQQAQHLRRLRYKACLLPHHKNILPTRHPGWHS